MAKGYRPQEGSTMRAVVRVVGLAVMRRFGAAALATVGLMQIDEDADVAPRAEPLERTCIPHAVHLEQPSSTHIDGHAPISAPTAITTQPAVKPVRAPVPATIAPATSPPQAIVYLL